MPEPAWYRNRMDGQRGKLLRKEGKVYVKLDRPNQEILVPYYEGEWMPEQETRKLNWFHTAKISFAADRELCKALGLHDRAGVEWESLREEDRQLWAERGPNTDPKTLRMRVFQAIMAELEPETTKPRG